MCENALNGIALVEACLNSSFCGNASGNLMFANSMHSVTVTFTNLEENRKYSASVHVQYNGGVVQQSQPVEISERCYNLYNIKVGYYTMMSHRCDGGIKYLLF